MSANPLLMLQQLGTDWQVELVSKPSGDWSLTLTPKRGSRTFTYEGPLFRVITRAFLGDKPDRT